MAPRRDQSRRVTPELIAFHARRGRELQRVAIHAALRALIGWLRAALGRRRL
ncbi:hypothetical protein [Rhodopseudomonas palustris]|uniref:hypothetical protein n=1 Tax=Rhodopseudomonas palustris TaxID=1076 RepID=UPI000309D89B|nr:hypothetical protein [Rhodopseudomonas palustris]